MYNYTNFIFLIIFLIVGCADYRKLEEKIDKASQQQLGQIEKLEKEILLLKKEIKKLQKASVYKEPARVFPTPVEPVKKIKEEIPTKEITTKIIPNIGVFYSSYTKLAFDKHGWNYEEYIGYVKYALDELAIKYELIYDLAKVEPAKYKVLILPNVRCVSKQEVDLITKYVNNGGKIFATYTTSFRNENDEYAFSPPDFQLGNLLGIKYVSWTGKPPKCHYIKRTVDESHPLFNDLPEYVRVFRYTAMCVTASSPENIAAMWYDEDKTTPSFEEKQNASIVLTKNTVYTTEDLFAPENCHNKIIRKLIRNIITYLLDTKH